jgi:AcrR family transcriptional regulator
LIAAALKAFTPAGYDGVSVREIERKAGVNRGLVSYHFGTREVL